MASTDTRISITLKGGTADILVRAHKYFVSVESVLVPQNVRRRGVGLHLYRLAATHAAIIGLPLVSGRARSHFAEAFWRAQVNAGRAVPLKGVAASVVWSPWYHQEEHLSAEAFAELSSNLPVPNASGKWDVSRYRWVA